MHLRMHLRERRLRDFHLVPYFVGLIYDPDDFAVAAGSADLYGHIPATI